MAESVYVAAHQRVQRERGKASTHKCICGRVAYDWAFQHLAGIEVKYSPAGKVFSENPTDYLALCRRCHKKLDKEKTPERYENNRSGVWQRERLIANPGLAKEWVANIQNYATKRRRCLDCGMESTTAGIGTHLKASKHVGYLNIL